MFATLLAMLAVVPFAGQDLKEHPTLDKLAAEAETRKSSNPERWREYEQQVERVFAHHDQLLAHWRRRAGLPQPNLRPLNLPLVFLIHELRRQEKPAGSPAAKARGGPSERHAVFLAAVEHSADERRIPALLEYKDHYLALDLENKSTYAWNRIIASAATEEWATAQVTQHAKTARPFAIKTRRDDLLYCLIDRFAGQLPTDVQKEAYAYIAKGVADSSINQEAKQAWDVLFRLDARRAGKEILPYFATPSGARLHYNYHVIALLSRYPGSWPEVEPSVRRWLADQANLSEPDKRQLRRILETKGPGQPPGSTDHP